MRMGGSSSTIRISGLFIQRHLVSGKADVVFWYEASKMKEWNLDAADDVILSEPYLEWQTFMHLRFDED